MEERLSTQYRALLIGNADFPGNLPALDGPLADVEAMRGALTHATVGLYRSENVESLLDKDARVLRLKISEFLRSSQDGQVLLLYYSGHGELDEDGNLYLCASDTDPQHLEATSVTCDYLSRMAERVPERIPLMIILDCCNSGAFKSGMSPIPEALWSTGRYVLTSSRARQLSYAALVPGQASVFTHYLVEGLLYAPSAGHLTIDELDKYVHTRVTQTSKQIPQHKFSGGGTLAGRAPQ